MVVLSLDQFEMIDALAHEFPNFANKRVCTDAGLTQSELTDFQSGIRIIDSFVRGAQSAGRRASGIQFGTLKYEASFLFVKPVFLGDVVAVDLSPTVFGRFLLALTKTIEWLELLNETFLRTGYGTSQLEIVVASLLPLRSELS